MLSLPYPVNIFVASSPTDMRKSFDGLSAAVQAVLQQNPLSGHLFVFFNRRRDQVRILFWERGGFCVLAKRLEQGRFKPLVVEPGATHVMLNASELTLILAGIDLRGAVKRKRWEPSHPVGINQPTA
jgi:transposase